MKFNSSGCRDLSSCRDISEYNPEEFLHNDLKASLKNKPLPEDTSGFINTIRKILKEIAILPERIKGYFQQAKIEIGTI